MKQTKINLLNLSVILLSLVATGCISNKPVAWNVAITKVTPASITVDVVGINAQEKQYWMNDVTPGEYWKGNSRDRKGVEDRRVTTNFEEGQTWKLSKTDPIWKKWLGYGSTDLMIMANLPGDFSNSPSDRRRMFIPLNKKIWDAKNKTLEIEVQDGFVRVLTPQK